MKIVFEEINRKKNPHELTGSDIFEAMYIEVDKFPTSLCAGDTIDGDILTKSPHANIVRAGVDRSGDVLNYYNVESSLYELDNDGEVRQRVYLVYAG